MSCVSWCQQSLRLILVHLLKVRQQSLQVFVFKSIALRRSVERDGGDAFCDV